MNKKSYILSFLFVILFSLGISYSLVVAGADKKDKFYTSSKIIFSDSLLKDSTKLFIKTDSSFKDFNFSSNCKTKVSYLDSKNHYHIFRVLLQDKKCLENRLILKINKNDNLLKTFRFKVFSDYYLYSLFLDLDTTNLEKMLSIFKKSNKIYLSKFVKNIINKREKKYKIPVLGYKLPTKLNKIPNTGRPYRKAYTDGIHHSWDIDTSFGKEVISVDNGIIVRVVDNWKWQDLNSIKHYNLSYEDKLKNLDILRGNQVWLKTFKGDVVFYAHLSKVDVKKGDIVTRGQNLGKVGISGVPEKGYKDYHLDFSIQKNPYNIEKIGKNTFLDYMNWPWYLKGKSLQFILDNQYNIFEK